MIIGEYSPRLRLGEYSPIITSRLRRIIFKRQEMLSAAGNTDALQTQRIYLIISLVDVVRTINVQSSSFLEMAISEITKLDISADENHSCYPVDYILMEHDPAKRREISSDANRNYLIEQGNSISAKAHSLLPGNHK